MSAYFYVALLLFLPDLCLPHPRTPGLEVLGVSVPQYGLLGGTAVLSCLYSSPHPVYSVRWYKGGKEFYSFLPGKQDPISVHRMPGVRVQASLSSISTVHLSSLSPASTGRYRCEVSGEAPMFATDSQFGDLLVVVVPEGGPTITGAHDRYQRGEEVRLNCTVARTMPPANITWYINQRLVSDHHVLPHPVSNWSEPSSGPLHTAVLELRHTLAKRDFRHGGGVKFKCVAAIYDAYYKVNEISAERGRKRRRVASKRQHGSTSFPGPAISESVSISPVFWVILLSITASSMLGWQL